MYIKVKTSELEGAALDWAVAIAEGMTIWGKTPAAMWANYSPSADWAEGGPIIEREHISIEATRIGGLGDRWMSTTGDCAEFADVPLVAAMRCYVSSKLGDTVEIPKELVSC